MGPNGTEFHFYSYQIKSGKKVFFLSVFLLFAFFCISKERRKNLDCAVLTTLFWGGGMFLCLLFSNLGVFLAAVSFLFNFFVRLAKYTLRGYYPFFFKLGGWF